MTSCEALHTVARRYWQKRIAYWHQRYARLGEPDFRCGRDYSDKHQKVFPRYNVLEAILMRTPGSPGAVLQWPNIRCT